MKIELEIGLASEIPMNIALEYLHGQRNSAKGGVHVVSKAMTLNQNTWHGYKFSSPYVVDEFSQIQLTLFLTGEVEFIGICLSKQKHILHEFHVEGHEEGDQLCFHLYGNDRGWRNAGLSAIPLNLALGKGAIQNSNFPGYMSSNAVDGNLNSVIYTGSVLNPSWEVQLEGEHFISSIVLHKNTDPAYQMLDDSSNMNVMVFDKKNIKVYHSAYFTLTEAVKTITLPNNTPASRVVVTLTDEEGRPRILSLKEVEVYLDVWRVMDRGVPLDIPLGKMFSGKEVNYVTFVQGTSDHPQEGKRGGNGNVSHIANMKFINGSNPGAEQAYKDLEGHSNSGGGWGMH